MNTCVRTDSEVRMGKDMKKVSKEEKQEWLSRGLARKRDYYRLQRERSSKLSEAAKCTPTYGGIVVAGSSNPHKFERVALVHDDIDECIAEIEAVREEIRKAIDTLRVPATSKIRPETVEGMKKVLLERYVNFLEFKDVAQKLGYSEYVYTLHSKGLEHICISRTMIKRAKAKKRKTN